MKTYDEMTQSLIKRREEYILKQKQRKRKILGAVTGVFALCLASLLAFQITKGSQPDINISSKESNSSTLPHPSAPIGTGDVIGIVIIDGVSYVQFEANDEDYTADRYLGDASQFDGTYKTHLCGISAALYTTRESEDVLMVKLGNGGTVMLKRE